MPLILTALLAAAALPAAPWRPGEQAAPAAPRKHVLAWADVPNCYQHEAISPARPLNNRAGIWTGEPILAHKLDFFDAIFFFGVREIDLTDEQKADFPSFVKD